MPYTKLIELTELSILNGDVKLTKLIRKKVLNLERTSPSDTNLYILPSTMKSYSSRVDTSVYQIAGKICNDKGNDDNLGQ